MSIPHNCGVVGVFRHPDAVQLTYKALISLQHRGQEAAGIVTPEQRVVGGIGLVKEVFTSDILQQVKKNSCALGHVRYATTGGSHKYNIQPIARETKNGWIAVAHNGNIPHAKQLRDELLAKNCTFETTMDTEVILHLLIQNGLDFEGLQKTFLEIQASFCLVIFTEKEMIIARDAWGMRPLCIGKLDDGWIVASETTALKAVGVVEWKEVVAGEIIRLSKDAISCKIFKEEEKKAFFPFEIAYFYRPESTYFDRSVAVHRENIGMIMGQQFARKIEMMGMDEENTLVIPIPDSGIHPANGLARFFRFPRTDAFIRNHFREVGRSFLQVSTDTRKQVVNDKISFIADLVKDKNVICIDDSIVRGHTSKRLMHMLREADIRQIAFLSSFPKVLHPCFYGIDFPTHDELIAVGKTDEQIAQELDVDFVGFISPENFAKAISQKIGDLCQGCYRGIYPTEIPHNLH